MCLTRAHKSFVFSASSDRAIYTRHFSATTFRIAYRRRSVQLFVTERAVFSRTPKEVLSFSRYCFRKYGVGSLSFVKFASERAKFVCADTVKNDRFIARSPRRAINSSESIEGTTRRVTRDSRVKRLVRVTRTTVGKQTFRIVATKFLENVWPAGLFVESILESGRN